MFSKELESAILASFRDAKKRRHDLVSIEHLFLSLLYVKDVEKIIISCGGNVEQLKSQVDRFLETRMEKVPQGIDFEPSQTVSLSRVLNRVVIHVYSSGKKEAGVGDILAAFYREEESFTVFFLKSQGINRLDILRKISHPDINESAIPKAEGEEQKTKQGEVLQNFTTDMVAQAKAGKYDRMIGRDDELKRMILILSRRKKNNPVLVGEPGVGKTAVVEGLAIAAAEKKLPKSLSNLKIFMLDVGSIVAGTKFRGDFEQRLKSILQEAKRIPNAVLFIDEIHTIVGAGAAGGGSLDLSNILKPVLSSGELKFIGATTYKEYRNYFEKDSALSRRFQKIEITEPDEDTAYEILKGLKGEYEKHFGVTYHDSALRLAVKLSKEYINNRFLPDKAIDVIDEAGASVATMTGSKKKKTVGTKEIESVVSLIARVPIKHSVTKDSTKALQTLELDLSRKVFGQNEAITAIVSSIKRNKAGLGNTQKPVGSFLFAGPTGVGKTEISKQLSITLGLHFERIDMSEYMEMHSVSRLIGAPPGYVGFEQGGLLVEAIKKHPNCVLLLDEIEKAHPSVFNILLQVMDYSKLTDNTGSSADFRNVILIMTSNVGSAERGARSIGFSGDSAGKEKNAIEKFFPPEFRNRLDAVVQFNQLSPEIMGFVVDKFIDELRIKLLDKKVRLSITERARKRLAEQGYSPEMGARPLARVIESEIHLVLSDEILFGSLVNGGEVKLDANSGGFKFSYSESSKDKTSLTSPPSSK